MRRNHIHFRRFRPDQTHPRRLISVDAALSRTEIAFAEVRICPRPFLRCVDGCYELIAGDVIVEEEGRGDADEALWNYGE